MSVKILNKKIAGIKGDTLTEEHIRNEKICNLKREHACLKIFLGKMKSLCSLIDVLSSHADADTNDYLIICKIINNVMHHIDQGCRFSEKR